MSENLGKMLGRCIETFSIIRTLGKETEGS